MDNLEDLRLKCRLLVRSRIFFGDVALSNPVLMAMPDKLAKPGMFGMMDDFYCSADSPVGVIGFSSRSTWLL